MIKYNEEHEWLKIENGIASVGVSSYAVEQLGDITFIELPEIHSEVSLGDSVAFVESVKAASDIYTPVSGTILEVNEELLDAPEILNSYAQKTMIFKIKLNDESELDSLISEEDYQQYIKTL
jgi:glycine cleavage system H protein